MAFLGKTGLILSSGMLLAGGILLGIGAWNGGIDQVLAMAENGELGIMQRWNNRAYVITDVVYSGTKTEQVSEYRGMEMAEVFEEELFEGNVEIAKKDEIENLVIDWSSDLNISLISGEYFQMTQEDASYKIDGNTIHIFQENKNFGNSCTLYIPESWVGKEMDISVGTGTVYADHLRADKIDISVGAGYMEGNEIITEQLEVEVGSGSLELSQLQTKDAETKIGLGMFHVMLGTITGNLEIDCGMGGIDMYLTGKESDHNYKVSSIGNLNIGTYNHAGLRADYEINNHASSDFEIRCGLGNINIYFEE